jgi:hypothetical protein
MCFLSVLTFCGGKNTWKGIRFTFLFRFFIEIKRAELMKNWVVAIWAVLASLMIQAQESRQDVVTVTPVKDSVMRKIVSTSQVYAQGLDTAQQVKFWRRIMRLTPDSGLVNMQGTRKVFATFSSKEWEALGEPKQMAYRDSVRKAHNIADSVSIFFTKGKNDFYNAEAVLPEIDRAIPIFIQENVDPFYAQAILLIESPGKVRKSNVGAMGSFQLMKSVAIKMGLKVNKYIDERKDFDKSAWAAAKLIRTICIPLANQMLEKRGIAYNKNDLWYRLLVLHIYHAGAGNVEKVLAKINPCEGGISLIQTMWVTKAGSFGNSSQNYSQLALAALVELDCCIRPKRAEPEVPEQIAEPADK